MSRYYLPVVLQANAYCEATSAGFDVEAVPEAALAGYIKGFCHEERGVLEYEGKTHHTIIFKPNDRERLCYVLLDHNGQIGLADQTIPVELPDDYVTQVSRL